MEALLFAFVIIAFFLGLHYVISDLGDAYETYDSEDER